MPFIARAQGAGSIMHRVHLTRDSVAAGDDFDPPHSRHMRVPKCDDALALVGEVLKHSYLPGIAGGKATWVVTSHEPFAVCAQEWAEPKNLRLPAPIETLATEGGEIRLHFSYIGQVDPMVALNVLRACAFDLDSVG